jgi:hypothetical protein
MDPSARNNRDLLEAMESVRAHILHDARIVQDESGDLNDPQFAELSAALGEDEGLRARFDRLQKADAAIKDAFADVPVPADLAGRVLLCLSEAAPAKPVQPIQVAAETELDSPALLPSSPIGIRPKLVTRFQLIAGFAVAAASVAIAAGVWMHSHRNTAVTSGQAIETAMDFFDHDNAPPGEPVSRVAPPVDFPMSQDIARLTDVRWRRVDNFMGSQAVAYDLPSRGGKATLYVANRTVAGLPDFPPPVPTLSTGGNSAAAWQSGNLVYVLVVQGDAQTYADYLDHSHGPLT